MDDRLDGRGSVAGRAVKAGHRCTADLDGAVQKWSMVYSLCWFYGRNLNAADGCVEVLSSSPLLGTRDQGRLSLGSPCVGEVQAVILSGGLAVGTAAVLCVCVDRVSDFAVP